MFTGPGMYTCTFHLNSPRRTVNYNQSHDYMYNGMDFLQSKGGCTYVN